MICGLEEVISVVSDRLKADLGHARMRERTQY